MIKYKRNNNLKIKIMWEIVKNNDISEIKDIEEKIEKVKVNYSSMLLKLIFDEIPFINPFYGFDPWKRIDWLTWIRNKNN
jgi:hypothetical protein